MNTFDRRGFLRRGGMAAAVGAAFPLSGAALPGSPAQAATALSTDPDQLFAAAWFAAADRGYARQLRHDPDNAHALAQRGYIAVLSNRFGAAETFLTKALQLAPDDGFSRGQLADCYVRQDQFARAVPLLRQLGDAADVAAATQYAALTGVPYQLRGAENTRVPIVAIDPLPIIEASLNGVRRPFVFDTGATTINFSQDLADELGMIAVSSVTGRSGDGQVATLNFGILESLRIGEIEVRNFPVSWGMFTEPAPPNGPMPMGAIGTVFFYHFLTTLDYQGRGFVLRRKSDAGLRRFQAAARRKGYRSSPLWLAEHFPCTLGSLDNFGPRVVSMDTGGQGIGISCTEQVAQEAGIPVDDQHLTWSNGAWHPSISPDRIALGDAVGRHVPGVVTTQQPGNGPNGFRFQNTANFTHEFFKPFAVTLDFLDMNLYVTPTVPDHD